MGEARSTCKVEEARSICKVEEASSTRTVVEVRSIYKAVDKEVHNSSRDTCKAVGVETGSSREVEEASSICTVAGEVMNTCKVVVVVRSTCKVVEVNGSRMEVEEMAVEEIWVHRTHLSERCRL